MVTVKDCNLCFNVFEEESEPCYPPKLPEICCKYLHSSLTQEILSNQCNDDNVSFCPKCSESVTELYDLNDQLEFYQKRISEFIFIRSLEILHRREKNPNSCSDENRPSYTSSEKELLGFGVSALPNCEILNPRLRKTNSYVPEENIISTEGCRNFKSPEDVCDEELNDPLLIPSSAVNVVTGVMLENIKVDSEFDFFDESQDSNTTEDNYTDLFIENTKQNPDVSTGDTGINPILKLRNPNYCDGKQKIILMENEQDNLGAENSQIKLQTSWSKSDLSGRYKMRAVKKTRISDHWPISSKETAVTNSSSRGNKLDCHLNPRISEIFRCVICDKTFQTEQELEVHTSVHVKEGEGESNEYLPKHKTIPTKKLPLKSEVPKKRFRLKRQIVTSNKISHKEKKPFKCDICGARFCKQASMMKHKIIHSGEQAPYCEICGKGFPNQSSLEKHRGVHTGERPFKCEVCGKGFTLQCNLTAHRRIHTGEKLYKCEVCGKEFTHQGNLKRHKRIHSDTVVPKNDV